ncbi:MAG: GNAT family N-acetyltransferase, partial [Enterococcus sp.]|nr:GNAT family N-acetyltransferase [Enterococcus sp.]
MQIVNFRQEYQAKVIDLWNRCCYFDTINEKKFLNQVIFDDNFDASLSFVALEGGRVVGFGFGTKRKFPYMTRGLEPERGWVNVLFVAPEFQRRGIASQILE